MKAKLCFFGIFLILIACIKKEKKPAVITANLEVTIADNPFAKSMSPLRFLDSNHHEFKGIINSDSSFVMCLNTVRSRDMQKAIKEGRLKRESVDSVRTKIYALSGFNKGKQYFIIDFNGNKDFSDDRLVEFSKNVTNKENYRDSFNIKKMNVVKLIKGEFLEQQTYLQFLPAPDYFTYKQETEEEKFKHSLQLAVLKHDYLFGTFKLGSDSYGVGANKGWKDYEFIFKKSDTSFYSSSHQLFAKYLSKDTLKLSNDYYVIDSLNISPPKLILKQIDVKGVKFGFRANEISKNYEITDLENNKTTLKDLAKEKGYILLDFWGTWCVPCKELTPELVRLHQVYKDKIQFASLAFELDPKPVSDYTQMNGMNWFNGIIKGKPKSGDMSAPIIGGLRIECYPTFIVLDSELNILYRTCGGGNNYLGLKSFLKSKLE